jgi:formylmethanofuran dehydrogenase subunit E-like metal-binding protein
MTLTITSLIEKYSDMTSDDVLSHPDLGRDIETIGTIMNDATTTEVDKATAFLSDLSNNITAEITTLRSMQSDGLEAIEKIKKISEARLAYSKHATRKD